MVLYYYIPLLDIHCELSGNIPQVYTHAQTHTHSHIHSLIQTRTHTLLVSRLPPYKELYALRLNNYSSFVFSGAACALFMSRGTSHPAPINPVSPIHPYRTPSSDKVTPPVEE